MPRGRLQNQVYFLCDFETTGVDLFGSAVPIEVGGLILDSKFNILDTYEALINPYGDTNQTEYSKEESKALEYHKINFSELIEKGKRPATITSELSTLRREYAHGSNFIILSDNAQFEYSCMRKLFMLAGHRKDVFDCIFHYTAWDTNLLLCSQVPEVGDAVPIHRALPDAMLLYRQLIRGLQATNFKFE